MSPEKKQEIEDNLQRVREQMHAAKVMLYELAYRLRNLGYLPDDDPLSFPIQDQARRRLLNAIRRYANKNGLPITDDSDLDEIDSEHVKRVHEAVKKEHDG